MSAAFTRRHFFYGSLLAGAVPAGGFGSTPSLTAAGYKSFNEKLNIGAIGCGTRSTAIIPGAAVTENIVALCDVDKNRAARTFQMYPKATQYTDYRVMLEKEKSIDAVMIATPDHLHTPVALLAMQRGKHVYCEKPLTRTVWESQLLNEAALKYKVATQMGNQGFNHEALKTACEIVWSGDIGDVKEVWAWTGGIYGGQPELPETGPAKEDIPTTLDWDLWLGPAAPRDFNHLMTNQWRAFQDFSTGGSLGDWLVHILGPAHMALQLDTVSPISVEAVTVEGKNNWLWPLKDHIVFEFPARGNMPALTIHALQNMHGDFKNPEGMAEGDRLFPGMNNLATEKNRPFQETGDGMLEVDGLGPDGKPAPRPNAGGGRGVGAPGGGRQGGARGGANFAGRGPGGPGGPGGRGGPGGPGGANADRAPGNGSVFVGSKGYMATTSRGEGVWLLPNSRWLDYKLPPQILPRGVNHQQDWVRACKGGVPAASNFPVATKYIEWLVLGAIATRVPGKLMWDAKNGRFSNNEEANKYLKPYLRKGWELKV
ncbi:MAG TPA: Gfo/Idh/MocA family oxidoreductase [Bryobacteraceae bacterium]|nr:Gfo/Idh/MocA family oxidoreductase [Bryobacteraceae bacterium]